MYRFISIVLLLHFVTIDTNGYFLSDDNNDLASLESTPGVSLVFPRAIGPNVQDDGKDGLESTTTNAPPSTTESSIDGSATTTPTTTPTSTTTSTTTTTASTEANTAPSPTTTTISISADQSSIPFGVRSSTFASSSSSSSPISNKPNVNQVWHYNSAGLNSNSVWFSPSPSSSSSSSSNRNIDTIAVESNQTPVRVAPQQQQFFRRQPVIASNDNDETNVDDNSLFARRSGILNPVASSSENKLTFGEYRNRQTGRNLYFPDIVRIRSDGAVVHDQKPDASSQSSSTSSSSSPPPPPLRRHLPQPIL
ncbi:hypothetical protein RDWZM_010057 [Blomia tropicalis]|uniref:Uncharacterized protein n=1 Tax=Blomia tropicalis TaxID=40697 RepID=A0A9Q0LYG5_BLOTA|nr:hypothetical protein RDWZM_010057 [Blomia tropicalis]